MGTSRLRFIRECLRIRKEGRVVRQREKCVYDAVSTRALADPTKSSEAGLAVQCCPELG